MGTVVLNGATSGATTLQPTDAATVTLTLPSTTGNVALTTSGTPVADYWYLNTGTSVNGNLILSTNLSQLNFAGTGTVGTMSQSSGTWTFPQTGLYRVAFCAEFYSSTTTARFCAAQIYASTDGGSTFNAVSNTQGAINAIVAGSNTFTTPCAEIQINVNNTSNIKVQFQVYTSASVNVNGGQANGTYMVFTRLGNNV